MGLNLSTSLLRLERPLRERSRRGSPEPCPTTVDAKRCGASEDRALYTCGCGCAFRAEVTTSVGCPHCGSAQAW